MTDSRGAGEISETLLTYLRDSLGAPSLAYVEAPSQLFGGNRSFVYRFQLRNAPGPYSVPLILRVSRPTGDDELARIEAIVPTALAEMGYPVPRVLDWSDSREPFGGSFMIMERIEGSPMVLDDPPEETSGAIMIRHLLPELGRLLFGRWPALLADVQVRLHDLDSAAFLLKMESAGVSPSRTTIASLIEGIASTVDEFSIEGLRPGVDWLRENCPRTDRPSICHGDFFPNQVFAQNGVVTGVIDWSDVIIGPAELDVGIVKAGIETLPAPLGRVGLALQRRISNRYVEAYRRLRHIDQPALRYGEALRCLRTLLSVSMRRLHAAGAIDVDVGPTPYDDPLADERVTSRFLDLSRVRVTL